MIKSKSLPPPISINFRYVIEYIRLIDTYFLNCYDHLREIWRLKICTILRFSLIIRTLSIVLKRSKLLQKIFF